MRFLKEYYYSRNEINSLNKQSEVWRKRCWWKDNHIIFKFSNLKRKIDFWETLFTYELPQQTNTDRKILFLNQAQSQLTSTKKRMIWNPTQLKQKKCLLLLFNLSQLSLCVKKQSKKNHQLHFYLELTLTLCFKMIKMFKDFETS